MGRERISLGKERFRAGVLTAGAAPTAFSQMCLLRVLGIAEDAEDVSPTLVHWGWGWLAGLAQCPWPRAAKVRVRPAGTGGCQPLRGLCPRVLSTCHLQLWDTQGVGTRVWVPLRRGSSSSSMPSCA